MDCWSDEKCLVLIDLYQNHPQLWNPHLKAYRNKNVRKDSWLDISKMLELPMDEVEKKMRYLRQHFARELKRERESTKSGHCTEEVYQSKWFAYSRLLFLKDKMEPRQTIDNEGKRRNEEESSPNEIDIAGENPTEEGQCSFEQGSILENAQGPPSKKVFKSPEKFNFSRKANATGPVIAEAVNLMRSIIEKKSLRDEFSLFGEQVAMKVRKLASPYARFAVQNIINNVLFEAEMGKYDDLPPTGLGFPSYTPQYSGGYYSSHSSPAPPATSDSLARSPGQFSTASNGD